MAEATLGRESAAAAEQAAVEIGIELLQGVLGEPYVEGPVINGAIKRLDIIADDLPQDGRLRPAPLLSLPNTRSGGSYRKERGVSSAKFAPFGSET